MSALRKAAGSVLGAYNRWLESAAVCPSRELGDAVEELAWAVLAEKLSVEELLQRLDPDRHVLMLRGTVGTSFWAAKLRRGDEAPLLDMHADPAAAIRSVLLDADLPVPAHSAPTEPPPDDASEDPPRSGRRATEGRGGDGGPHS